MNKKTGEKILLAADIITLIIVIICMIYISKIDTYAATKAETKTEKSIKQYAKRKHKAKGIMIVGERGATSKILKAAAKKSKNKKYKKYYKYDIVEKTKVKIVDQYGGYITCKYEKGGVIDGVRDNWKIGQKVYLYRVYKWKDKQYDTWFCAVP